MRIKPIYPKEILKYPYFKGIRTGLLIGVGTAWIIVSVYNDRLIELIGAIMIFIVGSIQYIIEIQRDKYLQK